MILRFLIFFICVLLLYMDLFFPTLNIYGGISSNKILSYVSILAIVFYARSFFCFIKKNKVEFFIFLYLFLFVLFRTSLGGYSEAIKEMWLKMVSCMFIPFLISYLMVRYLKDTKIETLLLIVATVASVISVLCLTIPSFKIFLDSYQMIFEEAKQYSYTYRSFGFATNLLFGYSLGLAAIANVVNVSLSRYKWFLLIYPLLVISILVNARIGFVLVFAGFLIYMLKYNIVKTIRFIFFAVCVLFLFNTIFLDVLKESPAWNHVNSFFMEFSESNNQETTLDILLQQVHFPNTLESWFWGYGENIMGISNQSMRSDIGFCIQFGYGGVLYALPLYYLVYRIFIRLKRLGFNYLSYCFIVAFFIGNFKGNFVLGPYTVVILLIIYYYTNFKKKYEC